MKKLLASLLCVMMVLCMMPGMAFAEEGDVLQAAVEVGTIEEFNNAVSNSAQGIIKLKEGADITIVSGIYNVPLTIDLNGQTLKIQNFARFNAGANIYGGTINADGADSPDGIICADYHYNQPSHVTLKDVTLSALGCVYGTGLFYLHSSDDTVTLDNVDVIVSKKAEAAEIGSGVFYSPSAADRGLVEIKNGSTLKTENVMATFFATEVDIDGLTIEATGQERSVFRGAEGTVANSTITVTTMNAEKPFISDDPANGEGTISFVNSDVVVPENVTFNGMNNEGSAVQADPESTLPSNEGVSTLAVKMGDEYYATLNEAIVAAQPGDTITLLSDIALTSDNNSVNSGEIEIGKSITLDGGNYTITVDKENWADVDTHVITVTDGADVTIKNLTIDGNSTAKHGINVFTAEGAADKTTAVLENVTVKNCKAAAVVVNNSEATATNLTTSGNGWGSVNVDKGAPKFNFVSGNLGDTVKIWTELTDNVVTVPSNWVETTENGVTTWEQAPAPSAPSYTPSVTIQKPVITTDDGAAAELSILGTTLTITAKDGYEIADVTVNGVSKGAVAELKGLKTGDQVVVTTKAIAGDDEAAEHVQLVARSEMSSAKGKKAVKVYWFAEDGSDLTYDGYEIFRSVKRYEGYGKKPFFETEREMYWNTDIEEGTKYFYKVRGYYEVNGERQYSDWSLKAWRTVE